MCDERRRQVFLPEEGCLAERLQRLRRPLAACAKELIAMLELPRLRGCVDPDFAIQLAWNKHLVMRIAP